MFFIFWHLYCYSLKVPPRDFSLVMKQSNYSKYFNTDASHPTHICKWDHQWGDCGLLSCLFQCLCSVRSVSRNATKCFTAHRPEETICCLRAWSIRCSLFYYPWLEAGGYVSLDNFNSLCFWLKGFCANKWCVSVTLFHNKMLMPDKFFTTVSSNALVRTRCYNQHKMKVPRSCWTRMAMRFSWPWVISKTIRGIFTTFC